MKKLFDWLRDKISDLFTWFPVIVMALLMLYAMIKPFVDIAKGIQKTRQDRYYESAIREDEAERLYKYEKENGDTVE